MHGVYRFACNSERLDKLNVLDKVSVQWTLAGREVPLECFNKQTRQQHFWNESKTTVESNDAKRCWESLEIHSNTLYYKLLPSFVTAQNFTCYSKHCLILCSGSLIYMSMKNRGLWLAWMWAFKGDAMGDYHTFELRRYWNWLCDRCRCFVTSQKAF